MNFILKYKLRSINYNYLSKFNCNNIKNLPFNIYKSNLTIKNNIINSSYEFLIILFLLKFIGKIKPFIIKSKKDNLLTGIKKNDSLFGYCILRKNNFSNYYLKFITNYINFINLKKQFLNWHKKNNSLKLSISNINKIDNILINENKLIKNYNLELVFNQKKNIFSKYNYSNNINLFLSHLNFPFK